VRPLLCMSGNSATFTNFSVTLERAGNIYTSRCRNHRCVFWQPTMLRTITNTEVVSKVTVKQAIRNLPGLLADTIPCKLYNKQGQDNAVRLGGIERDSYQRA
jgi:hypothetical protein